MTLGLQAATGLNAQEEGWSAQAVMNQPQKEGFLGLSWASADEEMKGKNRFDISIRYAYSEKTVTCSEFAFP